MRQLPIVVAAALVGLAATAQAASPSSATKTSRPPNVEGVWALKLVTASVSDVPLLGDVASATVAYEKITIDQSGAQLDLREQVCDVRVQSEQSAVKTTIPAQFVDHIRTIDRPGKLALEDGVWTLEVPKHYKYFGVKPSIGTQKLPRDKTSPYVFDQDQDGHPGMTIELSGVLSGKLYIIQRSWDALDGKLYKSGQFAGPVNWHTDQIVLQKTGRIVGEMKPSKAVPDKSYFRLVPVDDNTTCKDITRNVDKLFK